MNQETYVLTMLVDNEPGVTARVSGLFASRGYNIETICGAPTANPKMSRITIWRTDGQSENVSHHDLHPDKPGYARTAHEAGTKAR